MAALLAMPRAAGLFHRAIVQSAQGTFFTPRLAADITAACAASWACEPTHRRCPTVDPRRLSAASDVAWEQR